MARVAFSLLMTIVSLLLVGAVLAVLPVSSGGLKSEVTARLGDSGVVNPVTAVLLNFRGYDTLLEVAVLMVAAVAVLSLHPGRVVTTSLMRQGNEVLLALVRLLAPLTVIIAGYLLWAGAYAPGGSFQAGAVLGALGILVSLAAGSVPWPPGVAAERVLLTAGLAVFVAAAAAVTVAGGALLEYPADAASALILIIETALVPSIAMTMVVLFSGAGASTAGADRGGGR